MVDLSVLTFFVILAANSLSSRRCQEVNPK